MIKRFRYYACLFLTIMFVLFLSVQNGFSQTTGEKIKGLVIESGSGMPLNQALISVSSTGVSTQTDANGYFSIQIPNKNAEIIIELPGYIKRNVFILGRDSLHISMVPSNYKSFDNTYNTPIGSSIIKDASNDLTVLNGADFEMTRSTTFDQDINGKVPGLHVIQNSGMPGSRTYLNYRGLSSIYCRNQPLIFIDGMIHDYNYTDFSLMDGFALNSLDILDIEDMTDVSFLKNGEAYLGGLGSNGVININTEQKSEASTIINFSAYTGMALTPTNLEVMNAGQYKDYLNQYLSSNNLDAAKYPWITGAADNYKYNNNTDWQKEIFKNAMLNKAHLFIKGGDEIATYNISTGYLKQNGLYDNTYFSRFNLRINGKVNITDRFSVAPNAKLSLADSYLPNMGYTDFKNPLLSALLKPSSMAVNARDPLTGVQLPFLDDVGVVNISNPVAVANNAFGMDRDYNFLSSVDAQYKFSSHLLISTLTGIDFNSARESIFLPDLGIAQIDSAYNSPGDLVNEYRSMQNHTTLKYSNQSDEGSSYDFNVGFRYMENSYKNVKLLDLNTASDYFKNLGSGTGAYTYLRTSTGDDRSLLWLSYFANANYNYRNKYYLSASVSYDGNSAIAKDNRYNFYPSLSAAWRLSSATTKDWLEDFKIRASWSQSGNILSSVYDYSKLYYTDGRLGGSGAIVRESVPNDKMEIEKKNTIDLGLDISLFKQETNIHLDYYTSMVNNLLIGQRLPDSYGFSNFYNNGGKLTNSGVELALDQRFLTGSLAWDINGTFTMEANKISAMKFVSAAQNKIVTKVEGAEYVSMEGEAVNAFYGYKTNGIFTDATEANSVKGPKGTYMQVGDVRFKDLDNSGTIDEADKTIIGNPNPDFYGGINAKVSYKGFDLSALFTYSVGNDAFNYVKYRTQSMSTFANQSVDVLKRGTGDIPRASYGDPTGNTVFSDRWIEDASYARLKKLTLSYTMQGKQFYKSVTFFATASNLLTLTSYSGYDPEFMYSSSPFSMGIDYGQMPQVRSFIIGLKLGL